MRQGWLLVRRRPRKHQQRQEEDSDDCERFPRLVLLDSTTYTAFCRITSPPDCLTQRRRSTSLVAAQTQHYLAGDVFKRRPERPRLQQKWRLTTYRSTNARPIPRDKITRYFALSILRVHVY